MILFCKSRITALLVVSVCLAQGVEGNQKTRKSKQFLLVPQPLSLTHDTLPAIQRSQPPWSPVFYPISPSVTSGRAFYGIANIYNGQLPPSLPTCQQCATCPTCLASFDQPASFIMPTASACTTLATSEPCTFASGAPTGTINIIFEQSGNTAAGQALVQIVPTCENTRVKLDCTSVPNGVLLKTQYGALASPTNSVTVIGILRLTVASVGTSAQVAGSPVHCTWQQLA